MIHPTPRLFLTRTAWTLVLLLCLCGCAASHKVNVYTLQLPSYPDVQTLAGSATSVLSILLDPVTVPELVNRPQLVVHTDDHQVKIIESSRWAQTLKDEVGAVLAANLARDLGTLHVFLHTHDRPDEPPMRVAVNILRFESRPGVAATIEALWTIRHNGNGTSVTGRSMVHETVQDDGYPSLLAAHGRALARISHAIAAQIRSGTGTDKGG